MVPGKEPVTSADLIGRDFTAAGPGQRLVGDITYLRTGEGWLYLATVIDLATRMVVGWQLDIPHAHQHRPDRDLLRQRRRGVVLRRPIPGRSNRCMITVSGRLPGHAESLSGVVTVHQGFRHAHRGEALRSEVPYGCQARGPGMWW
jgi:transposase InsO family protein